MSVERQDTGASARPDIEEIQTIPVIQEQLVVSTERLETGRVLVSKQVVQEETFVNATASSEEVTVERVTLNQYVQTPPAPIRQEGDVTIISVVKEVLVVEKRMMLVEEVRITKRQTQDEKTFSEVVRTENINITRSASGTEI